MVLVLFLLGKGNGGDADGVRDLNDGVDVIFKLKLVYRRLQRGILL